MDSFFIKSKNSFNSLYSGLFFIKFCKNGLIKKFKLDIFFPFLFNKSIIGSNDFIISFG